MTRMEWSAADPDAGVTLAEMEVVLRQAKQAGATPECVLMAPRVGWGNSRVKSLAIETDAAKQPGAKSRARKLEQQRKRAQKQEPTGFVRLPPGMTRCA